MKLDMRIVLGPADFVLDENPAPPPKRRHSPQFSAEAYCGQTARWIKMPLGTEVGPPDGIVLDGALLPAKRGTAPNFRPMSIVAKRSPISATAELLLLYSWDRAEPALVGRF